MIPRALPACFDRKVARLPDHGVLLYATDLQGNLADFERLVALYDAEEAAGNHPTLALCGDLVHGPSPDLAEPGAWPDHLGTPYRDQSAALIRRFEALTRTHRMFSLLGNHEHAHIGGPVVPKFWPDEAAVLDAALGPDRDRIHTFLRRWPLLAVGRCGVVLTHGAPGMTCPDLDAFEALDYAGYEAVSINHMYRHDVVGALLWSRAATDAQAAALLEATALDGEPNAFVAFGHDVVHEGYELTGDRQICLSTSYGLFDRDKVYLRLDLDRRYHSVRELRPGVEIRPLYGSTSPQPSPS
ncbi:MAG: metallophosphoesterase [Myxococcales bacterium]|nr:metallophosphoesterase [Myxococcales bacterium]